MHVFAYLISLRGHLVEHAFTANNAHCMSCLTLNGLSLLIGLLIHVFQGELNLCGVKDRLLMT